MASCQKCGKKFPCFTIRNVRHPNPSGDGVLCEQCYRPYGLVLEKYTTSLKNAHTSPKAAAWVAVCYILAAQRINLVRTVTAAILGITETENSWKVCRQRAMELATRAMSMPASDSDGQAFLKGLLKRAEEITEPPLRKMPIQRHASVWGDTILDVEYEAVMRSCICMDELNDLVTSLSGRQWLLKP